MTSSFSRRILCVVFVLAPISIGCELAEVTHIEILPTDCTVDGSVPPGQPSINGFIATVWNYTGEDVDAGSDAGSETALDGCNECIAGYDTCTFQTQICYCETDTIESGSEGVEQAMMGRIIRDVGRSRLCVRLIALRDTDREVSQAGQCACEYEDSGGVTVDWTSGGFLEANVAMCMITRPSDRDLVFQTPLCQSNAAPMALRGCIGTRVMVP